MKKSTVRGYPGFPFANITYLSIHMQWCVLQFWRVISLSLTKLKFSMSTEQFFFIKSFIHVYCNTFLKDENPKWNGALKYDSCRMVDDQKLKKVGHIV